MLGLGRLDQIPRDQLPFTRRPWALQAIGVLIWLGFVLFPVADAVTRPGNLGHRVFVIGCALALMVAYAYIVISIWVAIATDRAFNRSRLAALVVMLVVSIVLTVWDQYGWGYLFSYAAACASMLVTDALAYGLIGLSTVLAVLVPAIAGAGGAATLGFGSSAAAVGLIMSLMRDLRLRNRDLTNARSELARLAVAAERERFARDLHDLLGHSLSVIALKAELAGRLSADQPERTAAEVADIESVARGALHEIREAVSGYRQPTLDGELEGARIALIAAGVECVVDWDGAAVEPAVEGVLAWAVREGATNVIRHSAARHCTIRVACDPPRTTVEVLDDGPRLGASTPGAGGNGLNGLRERAAALRGTVAAGPLADGGFRLAATIPEP